MQEVLKAQHQFAFGSFEPLVALLRSKILGTEKLENNQDSAH